MSKLMNEIKEEIKFAKTTGMPVFVMGMNKVKDIVEEHEQKEQQSIQKLKEYLQHEADNGMLDWSGAFLLALDKMEELGL